jgi:hypothetical protein
MQEVYYRYNACKQGMKEKIRARTLHSSGVRDIGRVLKISKDTVTAVLKKNFKNEPLLPNNSGKSAMVFVGNGHLLGWRNGRVLEFRSKQIQPTLDLVRHRKKEWVYIGVA